MRKEIKLIVVLILLSSATRSMGQSTAAAIAIATILEPVALSSNQPQGFEKVGSPPVFDVLFGNGNIYLPREAREIPAYNSTIIAADFVINASNVYEVTIPKNIFVRNASGTGMMAAEVFPVTVGVDEAVHNGKKHLVINAGLQINNGQAPGRYASEAFDVTVNFN